MKGRSPADEYTQDSVPPDWDRKDMCSALGGISKLLLEKLMGGGGLGP